MNIDSMENAPGSYEQMLKSITRFIISSGSLLNVCDCDSFLRLMEYINPNAARRIEQRTVVKLAKNDYINMKKDLHSTFASLTHKISLACDVWRNEDSHDFMRITAHWIDSDWIMHRRITNFEMVEHPMHAASLFDLVYKSVSAWGIKDKIFSVTLDDVCDYDDTVEYLRNFMRPVLGGKVFHVGCACRALSSCIKVGLDSVSDHVDKIRDGIQLPIDYAGSFVKLCVENSLEPKHIIFDDVDRWDSTRNMLNSSMPYKDVLAQFIASNWPHDKSVAISEQDWAVVSVFCRFLDVFYEAVDNVSRNYYPSSSGLLLHLVNIAKLFSEYKGSGFEGKISVMEEKFLKHFNNIPDLYCLAAVMDPRIKLSGCECLVESFYQFTNNTEVNVEAKKVELSKLLHEMFNLYASQSRKMQQPSSVEPSASSTTSDFAWSLLSQKIRNTDELTRYLQGPNQYNEQEMKEFDILEWWKNNEVSYPVLSTMARDLLTTPLSTLAPDCAFLINEDREITDKSYHYSGRILEVYSCLKDWFNAEGRSQGKREPADGEESTFGFKDLAK